MKNYEELWKTMKNVITVNNYEYLELLDYFWLKGGNGWNEKMVKDGQRWSKYEVMPWIWMNLAVGVSSALSVTA